MDLNSVKENENLKNLDDDEIDNAIDLIFPAYHTIDEKDFYKATSDLSKYLNNKLSDESKEKQNGSPKDADFEHGIGVTRRSFKGARKRGFQTDTSHTKS